MDVLLLLRMRAGPDPVLDLDYYPYVLFHIPPLLRYDLLFYLLHQHLHPRHDPHTFLDLGVSYLAAMSRPLPGLRTLTYARPASGFSI